MPNDDEPGSYWLTWWNDLSPARKAAWLTDKQLSASATPEEVYRATATDREARIKNQPPKTPLSNAERQARYKARLLAQIAGLPPAPPARVTKARQPSRPARWAAAIAALTTILDEYQAWRDRLPEAIGSTSMAERLDDLLGLRDLVEQLAEAELPKGFGRD